VRENASDVPGGIQDYRRGCVDGHGPGYREQRTHVAGFWCCYTVHEPAGNVMSFCVWALGFGPLFSSEPAFEVARGASLV
jgi:hypothetical protein